MGHPKTHPFRKERGMDGAPGGTAKAVPLSKTGLPRNMYVQERKTYPRG